MEAEKQPERELESSNLCGTCWSFWNGLSQGHPSNLVQDQKRNLSWSTNF